MRSTRRWDSDKDATGWEKVIWTVIGKIEVDSSTLEVKEAWKSFSSN